MDTYIQNLSIEPPSEEAAQHARDRWSEIAKPVGSLGALEEALVRMVALTGDARIDVSKRCVVVVCADNGVVAQGVSPSGADVTPIIAGNVARGISSVNKMCEPMGIDCIPVDMGVFSKLQTSGILDRRIAAGTADISLGPAMTTAQALQAVRTGVELVADAKRRGYRIVATGEMGIGNTTTSTAMTCVFTGKDPGELTGPGAGLTREGVRHKVDVIRRAISANEPRATDAIDVLAKLGGFDIAAMCGMFLGGAVHRVPVIVDGFISTVAAYCAYALRPECLCAIFPSHLSAEPGAAVLLDRMGLSPVLHANMRLGEGTGAVCLIPLLDMVANLYTNGVTFADCSITSYVVDAQ